MKKIFLALSLILVLNAAAHAALPQRDLESVAATPPQNARLDETLNVRNTNGRVRRLSDWMAYHPAFLVFTDYTCQTLCGTQLALLTAAIMREHIPPSNYRLIIFGIDPKDTPADAQAMSNRSIPDALRASTTLLMPTQEVIDNATKALGYHYVYDKELDQYAHPAVIYVLSGTGRLKSVLSTFSILTGELRDVITSAQPRGLSQQIRLLCYGYDPASGRYTPRIALMLKISAGLTIVILAIALLSFFRKERTKP